MSSHPVGDSSKLFCLFCQQVITPIAVHGHMQCPNCGKNIQECCSGYNRFHSMDTKVESSKKNPDSADRRKSG